MKKSKTCCLVLISLLVCNLLLLSGCGARYEEYSSVCVLMGTFFSASFGVEGGTKASKVWDDFVSAGEELEQQKLSWRNAETEIAKINCSAGDNDGYLLSEDMEEIISICLELSERTDGAFDISIGNLTRLWNIDEAAENADAFILPSQSSIDDAIEHGGYKNIAIKDHRIYLEEGTLLDLGAIGKGVFLDRAMEAVLPQTRFAVLSAGGSILTFGQKANKNPWNVAIVDPFDSSKTVDSLKLAGNYFVATSGSYERFVDYEGRRYHHIINPKTGYPADSGIVSVTVVMPARRAGNEKNSDHTGLLSDALSTAIFVLGEAEGIELALEYGAEIMIVREDGSKYMSEGMKTFATN